MAMQMVVPFSQVVVGGEFVAHRYTEVVTGDIGPAPFSLSSV